MPGSAPLRRFYLSRSPLDAGPQGRGHPELSPADADHAVRVLRLRPRDRFVGLDGRGRAWTVGVVAIQAGIPVLECIGDARLEPRPGEPGAALPWIEVGLVLPRGERAEEIIDGLTQLGVAAISRLTSGRAHPASRQVSESREARVVRAAIEACKQSGRLWLPALPPVRPLEEWLASLVGGDTLWLDPRATTSFSEWLGRDRGGWSWSEALPLRLLVGPEGGFTADEESSLRASGAAAACLGPHTLRVETAACAALAIAAERAFRARRI
jgi:16S rRNA (uracil1498-N3)-methyltransferase